MAELLVMGHTEMNDNNNQSNNKIQWIRTVQLDMPKFSFIIEVI